MQNQHYVPEWYQKTFKPQNAQKVYLYSNRYGVNKNYEKYYRPVKYCFSEDGIYSLNGYPDFENDIENIFFGRIDTNGKKSIDAMIKKEIFLMDLKKFLDYLIKYLCMQYFRTPKGLLILQNQLKNDGYQLSRNNFLNFLTRMTGIWGTTWVEGVWEIVRIENDNSYFIVSDNPIITYNPECFPESKYCKGINDPFIGWIGTQTLFCLDGKTMLILTNRESLKSNRHDFVKMRRNLDPFKTSIMNFVDIIDERTLNDVEVALINFIIKKRSYKYISSYNVDSLFPEKKINQKWRNLSDLTFPEKSKVIIDSEMYLKYNDGDVLALDQDGVPLNDQNKMKDIEDKILNIKRKKA